MQKLIEAQTRSDLGWFFDDWVYRDRGLPDFQVAAVYPWETSGNAHVVTVTVENLGKRGGRGSTHTQDGRRPGYETAPGTADNRKPFSAWRLFPFPREIVVNDGSVPESDMSNNVQKIDAPAKRN